MGKKQYTSGNIPSVDKIDYKFKTEADRLFFEADQAPTTDIIGQSGPVSDAFGDTNFGNSKYDDKNLDPTFIRNGDYRYHRGEKQPTIEKWGVGVARAASKLGTRTLNGVISPIYGIGSAIKNADWSKIWDNDVTNANQEAEKKIDETFGMYSTKAAEDAKGFNKLAYVNTWAGDVLDGVSYSGAALLSGAAYTKVLSAASKLASLDKLGMSVAEAMGATAKIEDAADKTKFVIELTDKANKLKNGLNNGAIAVIGAGTEASANALNDSKEFEKQMLEELSAGGTREVTDGEKDYVKLLSKSVGNSSYAMNLPVIMASNWLTFGKTMLGSTATEKSLLKGAAARTEKDLVKGGYKASELSKVQKILDKSYGLRKAVGKALPEGLEEWEQLVVTKGVNDFYSKKYYNPEYNDFQESFSKGLNEAMSSEGLENFMIGAISGGIFGNATQIKSEGLKSYKNPNNDQAVNKALDYLNEIKGKDAFKETVGMLNRHASLSEQQDEAVATNNEFEIQNNKSDMLINYINHMVSAGKVDDIKSELDSYKKLSNDEFEQILGIELSKDKLTGNKEAVSSYLNKRLDKVNKIEQLSNTIDEVYPDLKPNIKDRFMYTAWTLEDAQDRIQGIQQEINTKLSKSFGIDNGTSTSLNILSNLGNINTSNVKETIKALEIDNNISPLIRQDVINKVQDLVKLKDRQQQFIAEYKALSNPKLQELLDAKDISVENEVSDNVAENKIKQEVIDNQPINIGVPVDNSTLNNFAEEEGEALSNDEVVKYLGDKIINRAEGEQFTADEQQHYENNKEAIEAYIINKQTGVTERSTVVTTPVAEENDEILSNGVTTALDTTINQDEELTTIASTSTKEFLSKRANALMSKFFKFGEKAKTWLRDETGEVVEESGEEFSKKNNTPEVSRDINYPNVATAGTEVTYNHNGKDIWMTDSKGTVVGYIGLENPLPLNATDEVIAVREELIKNRKEILSYPTGTINTIISVKGHGKLLTKIDKNNQLILDQAPSTRPQDMIDGRPLFLYDDGESLSAKNINEVQEAVVNEFKGTSFSKENPTGGTRIGVGRVYQAVQTANGSRYVIPVYTNLIKDLANFNDISKLVLTTFKDNIVDANTSNYSKIINTLQPFVFVTNHSRYSKNPNVVRIIEDKEHQNEGFVSVGGVKISFSDLKDGINTDKFIQALGTVRANLSIDSLNDPKYTRTLIQNNGLVTNAYTDSTGNYYVQPYIEVVGLIQPEETTAVQNVTSNNENSFEDKKVDIEKRRQEELKFYNDDSSQEIKNALANNKFSIAFRSLYFNYKNNFKINGKNYNKSNDYQQVITDENGVKIGSLLKGEFVSDRGTLREEEFAELLKNIDDVTPIEILKKINAKYDAELAALENKVENEFYVYKNEIRDKETQALIKEFDTEAEAQTYFNVEYLKIEPITNPFAGQTMTDDIDFDSSDAPVFSRTKLEGTKVNQKSKDILKQILPGLQLADEKLIEEVGSNLKDTYGMFHNMLIYLFKGATNQTMFHEAFHGVFRNILSDTERIAILNEAQVKYDAPDAARLEFLRQAPGNEKLNIQALTQLHYEERLSDDFAKFVDGEVNPSLGQRIINFFKKIFNLFNIFRNSNTSQIQEVFENTIKGSYAKRSIAASLLNKAIDLNKFGNAYSRVFTDGSIPLSAELDRTNAIANVLLAKVSEEVAKGTELKKVDVNVIANNIKNHYQKVLAEETTKFVETGELSNKGILASGVIKKFSELLDNAKRQISLTKKINFKGNFVDTSVIEEEEGVVDTNRENEDTNKLDSDKGKGFQEMTAISGIRTATHEIKLFLSNLPVLKDSVVQRDSFGFPLYHSFEKIYYKLEQSLVGTTTFNEQFAIMRSLAKFSPEINQVVEAIESITDKQQLTNFKQQFAANFNKQVLNYKLMTYTKKGNKFEFKMFDPNRKDVAVNLNTQWTATNITDPTNKETDDIRVFNDKLAVYEVSKEKVKTLIDKYWSNINGKNMLDETYKATVDNTYELAHKLGVSLSYDTVTEYSKVDDKNLKELTMTLLHYADTMYVNPKFTNARNFLNQLIKLETNVQTELFTSSFNNVENSVVYAIQHQSFASKLVRSLTNNSSASLALNDKLQSDPINYKNFVLEHTKGLEMFPIDGLKMQGDNIEGKKFNQIHSDDYLAMIINMFNNDLDKDKLGTEARAVYAPIIPAEKGLAFAFAGSKINIGLDENGKLDKNSLIHSQFEQLVFNELARIRQVMIDIKDNKKTPENLVDNYHTKKKLGLQFNMTDAISPILKVKLDAVIESTLDQTVAKGVNPSTFVQGLIQGELLEEVKNTIHDNLQSIIDKHLELAEQKNVIYKDEKGNYVTNKFAGKVENVITNWALNSYLFNASISTLINGDSAFYKGAEDNGKRFYQGYSMLKFADTSIIDNSFKYLTGGKMKINVIKDVELASLSVPILEEFAELTGNSNIAKLATEEYGKEDSINAADAQIFVSVGIYQELERLFGNDSTELREGFTNADIADALNRKQDKGILTIKKPFFYGVQYDNKLKRYVPIQVKCSIFPISNKFVKNNPLLAKHKALMDADVKYPQVLAFESTMKALSPFKANIQDPSTPSIVELDLNNYGEQVANPDHMSDSHNDSLRQLKMLFYGMVEDNKDYIGKSGKELKSEIALLDKANIEESLEEVVKAFKGNQQELMKFIQDAISSRNATSIMEDVFTQDANGKFQYPLDLINSKTTIQLISSIFSDRAVRQKFTGGSAPQASSVGLQIAPKESNYKTAAEFQTAIDESKTLTEIQSSLKWIRKSDDTSIDYIEAYAPAHAKEFFDADGNVKDNIPDELKQMLVYRIPTEGAHSMMAVKVVGFLPKEYGGAMLLPLEVTKQFGADFDFDKIFFISKEFKSKNGVLEAYKYIDGEDKAEERYDLYKTYNKESEVLLEDFSKLSVAEQNIKPARNNRLLENYMQILRSSNMLESLITPSGPGAIAEVYDKVKEPIKIGNFFTPLYQVFNKDLFHKISMLKGVAALQVSGHAWATEGNLEIKDKVVGDKTIEQGVKIKGKGIYKNLSRVMSDANSKIVEELSSMMAVILDAVKTPDQLPSIGISMKTLPMWSYLVRLGLGSKVASQFTSQQAVKDLSILLEANDIQLKDKTFVKQDINNIKTKYNQLYTDTFNELYDKTEQEAKINANASSLLQNLDKIHPDMVSNFKQLSLEDLEKFTGKQEMISKLKGKEKLDYLILQLTVLNVFDESQATIKELNQLNQLFSINKETGPNFEDVNGKLAIYRNLSEKDTLIDGIEPLLHSDAIYPYIKTVEAQMDVMQDHYNFASPFFNAVKDRVAQSQVLGDNISLTSLKDEDRNIVNGFAQAYLDAEHTFKSLFNGTERLSRKDFLTDLKLLLSSRTHLEHKFKVLGDLTISEKEQEWLKAMTLFKSLEVVNIKNSNEAYAALKGGRYELHQKELMINDITRLYNSKFKPLAEALIHHAFENTGFYTGVNSYTGYIHPSVLQSMGLVNDRNKVKPTLQSDYYNPEVLDGIVDQLIRNNAKKFTKVYDNEKSLFTVIDSGKTLILDQKSLDKTKLKEITDGEQTVKYIRFVLNEDYTPIYKLDQTTGDQITFRQVTYLGSPGKLVEINPFSEPQTSLPNNRYEKFTTKAEAKASNLDQFKEFAEDEVVKTPEVVDNEPNADNSENISDGQMEIPMSEDQLAAMFGEEINEENPVQSEEKTVPLAIDFKIQDLKLNIDRDMAQGSISEAKRNEMFELINSTKVTNDKEFGDLINKLCR